MCLIKPLFYVHFLLSAAGKKKTNQKKKDRLCFTKTNAAKNHGGIFSKFRRGEF